MERSEGCGVGWDAYLGFRGVDDGLWLGEYFCNDGFVVLVCDAVFKYLPTVSIISEEC